MAESLEEHLDVYKAQVEQYDTLDVADATAAVYVPDLHNNAALLDEVSEKASAQGKGVVFLGDIWNRSKRIDVYKKLGLHDPATIIDTYIVQKLGTDDERDAYQVGTVVDKMGGLDNYIQAVKAQQPSADEDDIRSQLEGVYGRYQSETFREKVRNIMLQTPPEEKQKLQEIVQITRYQLHAANTIMDAQEAKPLADVMNKHAGKVQYVIIPGNHDSEQAIHILRQQLQDPSLLVNANEVKGAIKVGDMRIGAASNVYGITHPSDAFMRPEEQAAMYPHMMPVAAVQDIDAEKLKQINPELASRSLDYLRITANGTDTKSLDVLLLHDGIGVPVGFKKSRYPVVDDVGVVHVAKTQLSPDGFIACGHIHKAVDGPNDIGVRTVRDRTLLITKEKGVVSSQSIQTKATQDVEFSYDIEEIQQGIETAMQKVVEQSRAQQQSDVVAMPRAVEQAQAA